MGAATSCGSSRRRHQRVVRRSALPCRAATPGLLDAARDGQLTVLDALDQLMGTEAAAAQSRKLSSRLHWAALPAPWRLEDYDFAAQPGAD